MRRFIMPLSLIAIILAGCGGGKHINKGDIQPPRIFVKQVTPTLITNDSPVRIVAQITDNYAVAGANAVAVGPTTITSSMSSDAPETYNGELSFPKNDTQTPISYRVFVVAWDSANNLQQSNPVTVTVAPGGGSGSLEAMAIYDSVPGVSLKWNRPRVVSLEGNSLVEYQIWRSDVTDVPVATAFQEEFKDYPGTRTVTCHTVGDSLASGASGDLATRTASGIPGIVPGNSYTYFVTAVYRSGNTAKISSQVSSGKVTPIQKPELLYPTDSIELDYNQGIEFLCRSPKGADTYQLQVSPIATFPDGSIITVPEVNTVPTADEVVTLSTTALLQNVQSNIVYWRVRACRHDDSVKGWIYTETRRIKRAEIPPPSD